jgi:hypothetical protein
MKKICSVLLFAVVIFMLNSCLKDDVLERYTIYAPVYKNKAEVFAEVRSNTATPLQKTGKLFIKDKFVFVNEINKGVHIIDFSNAASPVNKYFINIPGNVDIAVRDHYLYADCYTYLLVIDIADANNAKLVKVVNNVFPNRAFGTAVDTSRVVIDWVQKDTMVRKDLSTNRNLQTSNPFVFSGVANFASNAVNTSNGTGGSMARFALAGERLYTVSNTEIRVFNTTQSGDPQFIKVQYIGNNIETIFPFKDQLFIGSSGGMFIYSITNPDQPKYVSQFTHAKMCDPVITDGENAFITLRAGTACGTSPTSQLDIVNVKNLPVVQAVKSYPMTEPYGLAKDNNTLFICDGKAGLKVYDASNVFSLKLLSQVNIIPYDVITDAGTAIVVAKDGLYFISYTNPVNIQLLSKISTQ